MPTAGLAPPELRVLPYVLPDACLLEDRESRFRSLAWIPTEPAVVLGCSSKVERAVDGPGLVQDGIPVYRRPSGGESMFLSPRMIAVSLLLDPGTLLPSRALFDATGARVVRALETLGVAGLRVEGTSDLAIDGRKVLGSGHLQARYPPLLPRRAQRGGGSGHDPALPPPSRAGAGLPAGPEAMRPSSHPWPGRASPFRSRPAGRPWRRPSRIPSICHPALPAVHQRFR